MAAGLMNKENWQTCLLWEFFPALILPAFILLVSFHYPSSPARIFLSFLRTVKRKRKKRVRKRTNEQSSSVQFSSVQFKMVSMCSEKPICTPPHLVEVSPTLPLKWFQCPSDWQGPLSSFQGRLPSAASEQKKSRKRWGGEGESVIKL